MKDETYDALEVHRHEQAAWAKQLWDFAEYHRAAKAACPPASLHWQHHHNNYHTHRRMHSQQVDKVIAIERQLLALRPTENPAQAEK